ncbi:MAG: class II fructose-bisphosphate aldolase [Patescibacteria group bacterium]
MVTLKEILARASKEHWAVPHFNVSNLEMFRAVVEAAWYKKSPVLIGTSEGERDFIGLNQAVALIHSYREQYQLPFYLNADHTHSVEAAKKAIDAGYDSIHIDLSKLSIDENIKGTREIVEYARSKNSAISVEGEIGYIVTDSSKIYESVVEVPPESLARPEEAERFVKETGVDRLAPAVGSIHGIAANKPHLDFSRIERIRGVVPVVALVLHGGSGESDEQIKMAIEKGIANVHVSTDLRVAYVDALKKELAKNEYAPYKITGPALEAAKTVVAFNIDLFGSAGKV